LSIAVILNPRSRANRRDPGLAGRMTAMLGDTGSASTSAGQGRVLAAQSLARLDEMTAGLAALPPTAIAVHGGDGTLHKTLSSLLRAFAGKPAALPTIAILPGGTMNVVASSLGLLGRPESILGQLILAARAGTPLRTISRRCLKVDDAYGFVFGNGLMANFLEEYYAAEEYGSRRALRILAHTFTSGLIGGAYARKIFRPFEGTVVVDGQPLPWHRLTGVGAATVREVGLGFKLNHRADEELDRFGVLAIHGSAVGLSLDLAPVHRGQGISPKRAYSGLGRSMRVEATTGDCAYTVDGDLYRSRGAISVDLGPTINFFNWR
jgi:diacylglycerol kinase family enzyme